MRRDAGGETCGAKGAEAERENVYVQAGMDFSRASVDRRFERSAPRVKLAAAALLEREGRARSRAAEAREADEQPGRGMPFFVRGSCVQARARSRWISAAAQEPAGRCCGCCWLLFKSSITRRRRDLSSLFREETCHTRPGGSRSFLPRLRRSGPSFEF